MKKIIKNLMVVAVATLALAAFTGCPAAPAAPETPETTETPETPEQTEKGILESKYSYIIGKFEEIDDKQYGVSIEFTKDDTVTLKLNSMEYPVVLIGKITKDNDLTIQESKHKNDLSNFYELIVTPMGRWDLDNIKTLKILIDYNRHSFIEIALMDGDDKQSMRKVVELQSSNK